MKKPSNILGLVRTIAKTKLDYTKAYFSEMSKKNPDITATKNSLEEELLLLYSQFNSLLGEVSLEEKQTLLAMVKAYSITYSSVLGALEQNLQEYLKEVASEGKTADEIRSLRDKIEIIKIEMEDAKANVRIYQALEGYLKGRLSRSLSGEGKGKI